MKKLFLLLLFLLCPIMGHAQTTAIGNGDLPFHKVTSAATTNATVIKAGKARLHGWDCTNTHATLWRYIKFHNQSTTPTAGTGVVKPIAVPPASGNVNYIDKGLYFSTGLSYTMVTGQADSDTTAVAAGDLQCTFYYK